MKNEQAAWRHPSPCRSSPGRFVVSGSLRASLSVFGQRSGLVGLLPLWDSGTSGLRISVLGLEGDGGVDARGDLPLKVGTNGTRGSGAFTHRVEALRSPWLLKFARKLWYEWNHKCRKKWCVKAHPEALKVVRKSTTFATQLKTREMAF